MISAAAGKCGEQPMLRLSEKMRPPQRQGERRRRKDRSVTPANVVERDDVEDGAVAYR